VVALGVLGAVYGLSALSRRFPRVGWLQAFRFNRPQLSPEHQARMRQRVNVYAGLELIMLGVILPMGYAALTMMTFGEFTTTGNVLVGAGSVLCIGLGLMAIWKNRRPKP
jgi:hypothetical protein